MWWYELIYTLAKFKDYEINAPWKYTTDIIETKFGTYKIRTNTSDAANVSPAFERRDINYLLHLIEKLLRNSKKILFLDVGGDLGSYSVLVANRFDKNNVKVKCFEPIEESCSLIKENLRLNNIEDHVDVYPVALVNEDKDNVEMRLNTATPGSSSIKEETEADYRVVKIQTRKLDSILQDDIEKYDTIVFKIDVEGVEKEVISGAQKLLNTKKDVYIMVEDFVNPDIINYLEDSGWSFITKVTSYNSWWIYRG
jgi:FkbM family methyltransferase